MDWFFYDRDLHHEKLKPLAVLPKIFPKKLMSMCLLFHFHLISEGSREGSIYPYAGVSNISKFNPRDL